MYKKWNIKWIILIISIHYNIRETNNLVIIKTSIFSEKISPANDGLFVLDGLFVHEGLYVYVQLTYKFQLFRARSRGMKKIATDKK